ncbi:LysR family transcriptional regulator [Pseudonocardia lacus]|uniref:LysR family transcriptional regulator n=1 Tax=Pseudonocardia lacus TaxID=2835865 RepID=UPI001BDBB3F9|nr:LysR family transcriptional regulator [Pseudonocardia lacus]
MELRQLEYFVAVAEEAGFTRAADRVHVSQPGVSAQVRQLERELGAPLFDRSGRATTLTQAGAAALAHARAALAAAAALRAAVDDVNGLVRGRLVVGMVTACEVTPLFEALAAFHRAHPGIELSLLEDNSDRLVERVRTGDADLALVGVDGDPPAGLASFTVVRERLVAAVPAGHPLLDEDPLTLAGVDRHPVVCLPVGTGIRAVFDRACAERGHRPAVALQAAAPGAVLDLARRGLGVAILSESMVEEGAGLHPRLIDDVPDPAVLALVWADRAPAPALRELLDHARRAFGG